MLKKLLIAGCCVLVLFSFWRFYGKENNCPAGFGKVSIRDTSFILECAISDIERQRGLSGRSSISPLSALLFIFEESDRYGFWMKDMQFPIDIIWVDENRKIVSIEENIYPTSYPQVYYPSAPAFWVLEVEAGLVSKYKIEIGDPVNFSD